MTTQKQKILPSAHLYECFMPIAENETLFCEVLRKISTIDFYKGVEVGFFFEPQRIKEVRTICEENNYQLTMWGTPYMLKDQLNLSSLDQALREKSVRRAIELVQYAAECGATNYGLPSGNDPGDADREEAKKLLFDSLSRVAEEVKKYPEMHIVLEPLDRYAYKKQLIGPMRETVEWFDPLHKQCPNIYIHWDSAHEALGKIDLIESINLAKPYLAQFHLCNAILDPNHPMYGDLHMDVGQAPEFETLGFLTPAIGAQVLKEAATFNKADGIKTTYVSIEMRSHPGDDLWQKEKTSRTFLQETFRLAGV